MKKNKILPQSVVDKIVTEQAAPKSFLLYCVTWNLAGKFPPITDLSHLLPLGFDIYVISTQECGQSITASFVSSSMITKWTRLLMQYFDETCGQGTFAMIQNESLIALNIIIFVKRQTLSKHITNIESESIPTGIGGILGNKGAVAISFVYNNRYSFLFINSHFHAHQDNTIVRHEDYWTININCTLGQHLHSSSNSIDENHEQKNPDKNIKLTSRFDFVFWMGDLNYRINGNRKIMDVLLKEQQFNVMLQNDQLNIAKDYKQIFEDGFIENKIKFPPTYKYDLNSDKYDTSSKARIPSWTDRILYKTNLSKSQQNDDQTEFIMNTNYDAIKELKLSDHRPVFASFKLNVNPIYSHNVIDLDGTDSSDNEITKPLTKIEKINGRFMKKLSAYYHFLCFCVCCVCAKSSVWRKLFCLRSARVKMSVKTD